MSLVKSPNLDDYIERSKEILEQDPGVSALVTSILLQEPPIDQSPNDGILPIIYVGYSKNPISEIKYIGRDTIDVAGPKKYRLEFYNVIIESRESKEESMKRCQLISQRVRDAYQINLRMTRPPPLQGQDPLAITNEVIAVPFVLRSSNKTIQAINVIVRPFVRVNLR